MSSRVSIRIPRLGLPLYVVILDGEEADSGSDSKQMRQAAKALQRDNPANTVTFEVRRWADLEITNAD